MLQVILCLMILPACSPAFSSSSNDGDVDSEKTTSVHGSTSESNTKPVVLTGGSGQAAIYRIIFLYPDSPYRLTGTKDEPTDLIAFQIRSLNADGTIGPKHNFIPEYQMDLTGSNVLSINIMGKLAKEYEEFDMDMSKSLYFNNYSKTTYDDHVTFVFTAKSSIKIELVEYYLDFIDFYIKISDN